MSTRNTPVLQEIVDILFTELDEQGTALNRLESHFQHRLLVDVGNLATVGEYAEQLRLRITEDERPPFWITSPSRKRWSSRLPSWK